MRRANEMPAARRLHHVVARISLSHPSPAHTLSPHPLILTSPLFGLISSALVLENCRRITLSDNRPSPSFLPTLFPILFPLSSRLPHFTPASPSCLTCPLLSSRMPPFVLSRLPHSSFCFSETLRV